MDYLITFEDGSEAYLAHHGIKGMHWGVHNEETKQKYGEVGGKGGFDSKINRLERYDAKAVKYGAKRDKIIARRTARFNRSARAGKLMAKASKYRMKQQKAKAKAAGFLGSDNYKQKQINKAFKYEVKADKLEKKATGKSVRTEKLLMKQEKYQYKASKVAAKMNEKYGGIKISAVSQEHKDLGKKYMLSMLT